MLESYTKDNIAQVYSYLRALMPEKRLTDIQVKNGDKIISQMGLNTFADSIGFNLNLNTVSGQWDISKKGFDLIKAAEGIKLKAYKDTGGVWTIGIGTIKYPNGKSVKEGDTCTLEQAESYLAYDSKWVDACLDKYVTVKVNQNQFDALASFVYNIGETQFRSSTLLKQLNAGQFSLAASNFDRWIYDNGKLITGLANRRAAEKKLFLS